MEKILIYISLFCFGISGLAIIIALIIKKFRPKENKEMPPPPSPKIEGAGCTILTLLAMLFFAIFLAYTCFFK